jgi:hypothetical protein
MLKTLSSFSSR